MKKSNGIVLPADHTPAYEVRSMSTTEGRQRLPDVLQEIYGDKSLVVFHRYDRGIAVAVPLEAIMLLAGEAIDEAQEVRIRNATRNLLQYLQPST